MDKISLTYEAKEEEEEDGSDDEAGESSDSTMPTRVVTSSGHRTRFRLRATVHSSSLLFICFCLLSTHLVHLSPSGDSSVEK